MKKENAALTETLKREFKKDLELFEYFLVLLNSSSPIRNVELMWAEGLELFDPSQQPRFTTGDALVQLQPAGADSQGRTSPSPSTFFCDLVHGFGAYEEQTCARSDKPAKERCRNTGRSSVYPCHVGLTDIAVPVICDGKYLGTLFSGQVLTAPPSPEGFAFVRKALDGQSHIDFARLEEAYYRIPVITTAQLAEMVRMLELFARYLANSWKRLEIMTAFQQVRDREVALNRRELTEKLFSGQTNNGGLRNLESLKALARSVGLEELPDRVLVLRIEILVGDDVDTNLDDPSPSVPEDQITRRLALSRVAQAIEDRCQNWPNTLATVLAPGEICIFTNQKASNRGHERQFLDEIAQNLLRSARFQSGLHARIGISASHAEPTQLLRAYHEAVSAIESGRSTLNWFETLPQLQHQPSQSLSHIVNALKAADIPAINASLRDFLAASAPVGVTTINQLEHSRALFTWACEHLGTELNSLTPDAEPINRSRVHAIQLIMDASNPLAMSNAFKAFIEELRLLVSRLFSHREQKIVNEVHRLVREIGPQKVTIQEIAKSLKLSAGHLGRVYSRTSGRTLEEYIIREKLEMGKRLLLDPRLHVSEVADRCGFCNPAYFAAVFRKYMHCSPRAYANQPDRWGAKGNELDSEAVVS
jgi:AraC-like DNA-binding protein